MYTFDCTECISDRLIQAWFKKNATLLPLLPVSIPIGHVQCE